MIIWSKIVLYSTIPLAILSWIPVILWNYPANIPMLIIGTSLMLIGWLLVFIGTRKMKKAGEKEQR